MLKDRTNVNLKDKARNMKIQFLRNGLPLPGNFEYVTISQKDREEFGLDKIQEEEERDYDQPSNDEGSSGEGTAGEDSREMDEIN